MTQKHLSQSRGLYASCNIETRGPRATTRSPEWNRHSDMQMACNIFPIRVLLWQGNGLNSFWDILLTRLKCWNFQNAISKNKSPWYFLPSLESIGLSAQEMKWKIEFQDGGHGSHLGFPIGMILAIFNLQFTPVLPTKFPVNWHLGLGEEAKNRFSIWPPCRPSWIYDQHDFSYFWSTSHLIASYNFPVHWHFGAVEEAKNRFSKWRPSWISDRNDF